MYRRSSLIEGRIPEICLKTPCIVGIDEAGRGPVLGPMVYAICCSPLKKMTELKEMGFADSKTLTEEQREIYFEAVQESFLGWSCKVLDPHDISAAMLRHKKYNLNQISHDTAIELIEFILIRGVTIGQLYVDTVGDATKYQNQLKEHFGGRIDEIIVSPKADSLYPIVSAASICAKVHRDRAIKEWVFPEISLKESISRDFGSGYPGDPETKCWLQENVDRVFGFPSIIRFSWSTCIELLKKEAYHVEWKSEEHKEEAFKEDTQSTLFPQQVAMPRKRKRKADSDQNDTMSTHVSSYVSSYRDQFYTDTHLESVLR
jgi:ribonuclease H2 subunit A